MKQKFSPILCALFALITFTPTLWADDTVSGDSSVEVFEPVVIDNIYYALDDETMTASVVWLEENYEDDFTVLTIPATITYEEQDYTVITYNAFSNGYYNLTTIEFPATITTIYCQSFSDFASLTTFVVDAANPSYCAIDGVLYNKARGISTSPRGC